MAKQSIVTINNHTIDKSYNIVLPYHALHQYFSSVVDFLESSVDFYLDNINIIYYFDIYNIEYLPWENIDSFYHKLKSYVKNNINYNIILPLLLRANKEITDICIQWLKRYDVIYLRLIIL